MRFNRIGIILSVAIVSISCNPSKKIARADNAALERVTAKRPLLDAAGAKWRDLNPCVNDTILKYSSDTVYSEKIDTSAEVKIYGDWGQPDSLIKVSPVIYKYITKASIKTVHDSVKVVVVDKNALDSAQILAKRFELAVKDREVTISNKENHINDLSAARNKWRLYFILLSIGTGALAFLYVKQQFFKI